MSSRRFRAIAVLWALVLVVATLRATAEPGQGATPPAPQQPIPYSHKRHVAMGLQCRGCHVNPEAGKLMTYPPTATCMGCHASVATDRPAIKTLASFAASAQPIPWVRVYQVPDYVFWRHGTHLDAEVTCAECHGPVAERDVIAKETDVTTMLGCRRCHDKRQVFTGCEDCHEPRALALLVSREQRDRPAPRAPHPFNP
jgi:hypothetical protein